MADMIRVQNTTRNQLYLGTFKHDGEDVKLTLGSTSDAKNPDLTVPKPEQVIPVGVWEQAVKLKPVKGFLDNGTIRTFPAG